MMVESVKKVPMSMMAKVQANANELVELAMAEGAKMEDVMEKIVNLSKKIENVDTEIKTAQISKNMNTMASLLKEWLDSTKTILDKFKGEVHHTLSKIQGEQVRLNDIVIANHDKVLDRIDSIYEDLELIKEAVIKK